MKRLNTAGLRKPPFRRLFSAFFAVTILAFQIGGTASAVTTSSPSANGGSSGTTYYSQLQLFAAHIGYFNISQCNGSTPNDAASINGSDTPSPTGAGANGSGLIWPFATKSSSQYNRIDQGWDIQDKAGANIYAIAPGTINTYAVNPGAFGNDYPVEHLDNALGTSAGYSMDWVYYGHVHVIASLKGKHVSAGQLIAHANTYDGQNGSAAPPGWLEIGFAKPGTDAPVQVGGETAATPAGHKMHDLLINAQPDPGSSGNPAPGTGPTDTSSPGQSDCCPPSSGSGSTTAPLQGNDNAEKAFNFFVTNAGFTPIQAAGVVGNLMQESGVNPTSGDQSAGGVAGFTTGALSMASMEAWVTAHGEDPTSLKGQLDFILHYITKVDPTVSSDMKKANDVRTATITWENDFEGCLGSRGTGDPNAPGSCLQDQRIQYAQDALQAYGGNASIGGSGGSCVVSSSPNCQTAASGNAAILCEAEQFKGVYYRWGGGHQGFSAFKQGCPDPSNPPDNKPNGGPNGGNPSPCAVDCSGLVSMAVDAAFQQNYEFSVSDTGIIEGSGSQFWKMENVSQAQPGDIVTLSNATGHVEVVDHVSGNTMNTFGTREVGTAASPLQEPVSYWTHAYRWTGPGSN